MALASEKNNARGSEQFIEIEEGISILSIKNESEVEECITHYIGADFYSISLLRKRGNKI